MSLFGSLTLLLVSEEQQVKRWAQMIRDDSRDATILSKTQIDDPGLDVFPLQRDDIHNIGADILTYQTIDFVITDTTDFEEYSQLAFLYMVPVVTPEWLYKCIEEKRVIPQVHKYSPDARHILRYCQLYISPFTIDSSERQFLEDITQTLGGITQNFISDKTTHIVIKTFYDPLVKEMDDNVILKEVLNPTMKIVSYQWLLDCFKTVSWANEIKYSSPGPYMSITCNNSNPLSPVFQNISIHLSDSIPGDIRQFLSEFVRSNGGSTVTGEDKESYRIIDYQDTPTDDQNSFTITWLFYQWSLDKFDDCLRLQKTNRLLYGYNGGNNDTDTSKTKVSYTCFLGMRRWYIHRMLEWLGYTCSSCVTSDTSLLIVNELADRLGPNGSLMPKLQLYEGEKLTTQFVLASLERNPLLSTLNGSSAETENPSDRYTEYRYVHRSLLPSRSLHKRASTMGSLEVVPTDKAVVSSNAVPGSVPGSVLGATDAQQEGTQLDTQVETADDVIITKHRTKRRIIPDSNESRSATTSATASTTASATTSTIPSTIASVSTSGHASQNGSSGPEDTEESYSSFNSIDQLGDREDNRPTKRSKRSKMPERSLNKMYDIRAVCTNCLKTLSARDKKVLSQLGIDIRDTLSDDINTIVAPRRVKTEKFLKALALPTLAHVITPGFVERVLKLHKAEKLHEAPQLKLGQYQLSDIPMGVNNRNGLFQKFGIYTINLVNDIPVGTNQIRSILEYHGLTTNILPSRFSLEDLKAQGMDHKIRYILVAHRASQVHRLSKLVDNRPVLAVQWDWLVNCMFTGQVLLTGNAEGILRYTA